MNEVTLNIKKSGNSLGVRLPAVIAREANLHTNQSVKISVINKQVVITPILDESLTLAQRLENFDLMRHGGEAMAKPHPLGMLDDSLFSVVCEHLNQIVMLNDHD